MALENVAVMGAFDESVSILRRNCLGVIVLTLAEITTGQQCARRAYIVNSGGNNLIKFSTGISLISYVNAN
jgi:hypothetical protein